MKLSFPIAIIVAATLDSCDASSKHIDRTVSYYKGNRGNGNKNVCRLNSVLSEHGEGWYKTCKKSKTSMEFATCLDELFFDELTDEQRDTVDECWDLHVLSGYSYAMQSGKGEKDEKKCSKQVKDPLVT